MNSLLTALVLTAASILPVSAGVHDFSPENSAPTAKASGNCYVTPDKSQVCWQRAGQVYSVAIHDIDLPRQATSVVIDCKTGRWNAYGALSKEVLNYYMENFCVNN
jgi:hypothetical protein